MTATARGSALRRAALVPCLLALVVVSAACGNSVDKGSRPALSGADTIVQTGVTLYGLVLTDGQGRTLYQFDRDQNNQPTCTGACASTFRPYIADGEVQIRPANTNAIEDSEVRLTPNPATGQQQVSYNNHPLYFFSGDLKPGDVNGAGQTQLGGRFGAVNTLGGSVAP